MDPVRETPKAHQCVCLLIKGPTMSPEVMDGIRRAGEAAGVPTEILESIVGNQDKCRRMVDNPDQPFCDDCENAGHPQLPNQMGMQNIVKENTE